jgi:hypothetical protein
MRPPVRPLTLTTIALSTVALAACGGGSKQATTSSGAVLDRDALASDLDIRLSDAAGGTSPSVICPADLPVKVGLSVRCTAELKGKTYGLTVTVTGTDGGSAQYDVAVDDTAQ